LAGGAGFLAGGAFFAPVIFLAGAADALSAVDFLVEFSAADC
jgi:hypothetical protein